ncbi:DUF4129 domain-containing protein [Pseudalkalibacillus caeni]|uniref:DUF4129 domain-containing protein n=1 Tax=Exobacillus caeni TaxID=2574798 RepID=A0A5R9F460_9BACL|nr:DUF4129 domain-containing protein [Pseudalkalibacillus caeni]TLS36408.1 DUF4129 domain-containing protein [Pseudalkalibacillus caeni]
MKNWKPHFVPYLQYLFDGVFMFVLVSFFFLFQDAITPLLAFFLEYVVGGLACFFAFSYKKDLSFGLFFPLIAFIGFVGWLTGFSFLVATVVAVAVSWRAFINYREAKRDDLFALFAFTAIGSLVYYMIGLESYKEIMLGLVVFHLVFLLVIKSTDQYMARPNKKQLKWNLGLYGIILAGIGAGVLLFPVIKGLIKFVLSLVGTVFAMVFGEPIYWLLSKIYIDYDRDLFSEGKGWDVQQTPDALEAAAQGSKLPDLQWLIVLAVVIIAVVIWLVFFKKKLDLNRFQVVSSEPALTDAAINGALHNRVSRKRKPPQNEARRLLFQFEKSAAKLGYGRNRDESLNEWLSRIAPDREDQRITKEGYQKVRYGGENLTSEEYQLYSRAVKRMINQIKETKKLEKRKQDK